jgi:hypothetical protein
MIPVRAPTPKPEKTRPAYIIGKLEVVAVIRIAPSRNIEQDICIARIRPNVSLDGQAKSDPKKPAAR